MSSGAGSGTTPAPPNPPTMPLQAAVLPSTASAVATASRAPSAARLVPAASVTNGTRNVCRGRVDGERNVIESRLMMMADKSGVMGRTSSLAHIFLFFHYSSNIATHDSHSCSYDIQYEYLSFHRYTI